MPKKKKPVTDALQILDRITGDDPKLRKLIDKERSKIRSKAPSLPFLDDTRWRWVQLRAAVKLHRVQGYRSRDEDDVQLLEVVTVCGKRSESANMPGIFSRIGAPRCKDCCDRLGIPRGDGAPFNQSKFVEPDRLPRQAQELRARRRVSAKRPAKG